jgi:hypothetical protein
MTDRDDVGGAGRSIIRRRRNVTQRRAHRYASLTFGDVATSIARE